MKITPLLYHIQTNQDMQLFANKAHTQQHLRTQVQPNGFLNVKQDPEIKSYENHIAILS